MKRDNKAPASGEREIRTRATAPIEIRAAADGSLKIEGYAAVFDEETQIGDWFREVIRPGAFTEAIKRNDDASFLINHEGLPLARVASGTLKLAEDSKGLAISTSLDPKDPDVARIVPKMERGDLSKMSFAFSIQPDGETRWTQQGEEDLELREIIRVGRLWDVSIVTDAQYTGTEIALRSLEKFREARGISEADAAKIIRSRMNMRLRLASGR